MSLESLGLTAEQERLYRYLLRRPGADPDQAAVELVMPGVRPVLAELRTLGLVDGTLTANWSSTSPTARPSPAACGRCWPTTPASSRT